MCKDKQSIEVIIGAVVGCRNDALTALKKLLDNYHGEEHDLEYYDLIASDWLEIFIHVVYTAMQDVNSGGAYKENRVIPISEDLYTANDNFYKVDFHNHLRWSVSKLLKGSVSHNWNFEKSKVVITNGKRQRLTALLTRFISTSSPKVLVTSPYFKCSKFEWLGALWRWRHWLEWDELTYPINFSTSIDSVWRKKQTETILQATDLNTLVQALLPLHLPVILLEGFVEFRNAVLSFPVPRPQAVYSANALHGHLAWKLLVAEWRQYGTLMLYHQHGGGYGIDYRHLKEEYEVRVADYYYTFGWRVAEQSHVKSLSPPMPMIKSLSHSKKWLLLVCLDLPKVVGALPTFESIQINIDKMHRETFEFIDSISNHRNLFIRPYTHDYNRGIVEMMRKTAPKAQFDDFRYSSSTRFSECYLAVHNYLGTSWLETLALNTPTICFYPGTYPFREEVKAHISALELAGVLHKSGSSAALFINNLGDDIDAWWNGPIVKKARGDFVKQYANFSPDWKDQWEREFKSVINSANKKRYIM
jgi:putative transferase (TIGR04331 family)